MSLYWKGELDSSFINLFEQVIGSFKNWAWADPFPKKSIQSFQYFRINNSSLSFNRFDEGKLSALDEVEKIWNDVDVAVEVKDDVDNDIDDDKKQGIISITPWLLNLTIMTCFMLKKLRKKW